MANHQDAEITDIVVVLNQSCHNDLPGARDKLAAIGVEICSVDEDNHVIEGSVESHKVCDVQKLDCVDYVRSVLTYIADYPPGDPRDKDGVETDD